MSKKKDPFTETPGLTPNDEYKTKEKKATKKEKDDYHVVELESVMADMVRVQYRLLHRFAARNNPKLSNVEIMDYVQNLIQNPKKY